MTATDRRKLAGDIGRTEIAHFRAIGDDEMLPSLRRTILERMSRIKA